MTRRDNMSIIEKLGKAGVPGFRSGKKWKIVIASIVYFFIIMNVLVISLAVVVSISSMGPANIPATSTPEATEIKVVEESAPTVEEPTPEPVKKGLKQAHIDEMSTILAEAGLANSVEAEGGVMFVSLYDETLTWDEIELLTRTMTQYVYSNAGTGTATVLVYVDNILVAEGKYKVWSGSIEVDLKR
jgi:hypothetical protein